MEVEITYTPVNSTNINEVGYDNESRTLGVRFHTGATYHHKEVPHEKYEGIMTANSPGAYYAREIRGKYETEKVAA